MAKHYTVEAVHKYMYPATYTFRDEDDGDEPTGWTTNNGADCTTTIIATQSSHNKVLKCVDGNGATTYQIYITFSAQTTGTIETWFETSDNTKLNYLLLYDAVPTLAVSVDLNAIAGVGDNTMYHYRIVFNTTTDTYDHYLNGTLIAAGVGFTNPSAGIVKLVLTSDNVSEVINYFDAIGFSWDTSYAIGDNVHWRHYMESTDDFESDDVGTQGTSITWIDNTSDATAVEIVPEFNEHKKILRQTDVSGNNYSYHYFATQAMDGWCECWVKVNNVTAEQRFALTEDGTWIAGLRITASKFQYLDNLAAWQDVGLAAVNDTWYHIYIKWVNAANDTFDVWIDNIQYLSGIQTANNQVSGVNRFFVQQRTAATDFIYIDAPICSLDSDVRGDNRVLDYNATYTKEDITTTTINVIYDNEYGGYRQATLYSRIEYTPSVLFFQVWDSNSKLAIEGEIDQRTQNRDIYGYILRDRNRDALINQSSNTFTTAKIHDPAVSGSMLKTVLTNVGQASGRLLLVNADTKTDTYSPVTKNYPDYSFMMDLSDVADSNLIIEANGKIDLDDDKASGSSFDVDTASNKDMLTAEPVINDHLGTVNYFEIFGAINPDTGTRFYKNVDNSGTDPIRRWRTVNNNFRNQTDVDAYAAKLATKVIVIKEFTFSIQGSGCHDMGTTYTFKFVKAPLSIAQAAYYVIKESINFDLNEQTITLADGIIEDSKYAQAFEKNIEYLDSYASEIYETDLVTIDINIQPRANAEFHYFGLECEEDEYISGGFYLPTTIDTSRDVVLTFIFMSPGAAATYDGVITVGYYATDGSLDLTPIAAAANFDFTTTEASGFKVETYTIAAADVNAGYWYYVQWQSKEAAPAVAVVCGLQATYYIKRSV